MTQFDRDFFFTDGWSLPNDTYEQAVAMVQAARSSPITVTFANVKSGHDPGGLALKRPVV